MIVALCPRPFVNGHQFDSETRPRSRESSLFFWLLFLLVRIIIRSLLRVIIALWLRRMGTRSDSSRSRVTRPETSLDAHNLIRPNLILSSNNGKPKINGTPNGVGPYVLVRGIPVIPISHKYSVMFGHIVNRVISSPLSR